MLSRFRHAVLALAVTVAVALGGCARDPAEPARNHPSADPVVAAVAAALTGLSLTDAPFDGSLTAIKAEVQELTEEMDGYLPSVTAGAVTYPADQDTAEATLHYTWTLPSGDWTYDAPLELRYDGTAWRALWAPTVLHPGLDATTRLIHLRFSAQRAGIAGDHGQALVEATTVVRVGLDKTLIPDTEWEASARALATRLELDPDLYAEKVAANGPQAFVDFATFRQFEVPDILDIPGARGLATTSMLPVYSGMLTEIFGTLRDATAEEIEASDGLIAAGDQVGASGLQKTFDEQLRGVPGDEVYAGPRGDDLGQPAGSNILHYVAPVDGTTLQTSFDADTQLKAVAALADVGQPAAAVVVRPSDGAILAAAISPELDGRPDATLNHYAPGSTFKIVTALALLRHGYTAGTPVECSVTATAGGTIVSNYPGFPSAYNGVISLATALAQSCNTAFVNQAGVLGDEDLRDAAASLGAGVDYDAGGILYGVVPIPDSEAVKGQMTIGQGGVLMSPAAMAGVIASAAAGHTVVPWMVASLKPTPEAAPLTAAEAGELQTMLRRAVDDGLLGILQGVAVGGKSGTAEYGAADAMSTYAWMVAYTDDDRAVAVWVDNGGGSAAAGPVARAILE